MKRIIYLTTLIFICNLFLFSVVGFSQFPTTAQRITQLEKQLIEAEAKKAELSVRYSADAPQVKEQDATILRLKKAIADLSGASEPTKEINAEAYTLFLKITTLRLQFEICGYTPESEKCRGIGKDLAASYEQAIKNPDVILLLVGEAANKFETMRGQAKGAAQVSQIADEQNAVLFRLLVLQNQRIIALLEQLVKKK